MELHQGGCSVMKKDEKGFFGDMGRGGSGLKKRGSTRIA